MCFFAVVAASSFWLMNAVFVCGVEISNPSIGIIRLYQSRVSLRIQKCADFRPMSHTIFNPIVFNPAPIDDLDPPLPCANSNVDGNGYSACEIALLRPQSLRGLRWWMQVPKIKPFRRSVIEIYIPIQCRKSTTSWCCPIVLPINFQVDKFDRFLVFELNGAANHKSVTVHVRAQLPFRRAAHNPSCDCSGNCSYGSCCKSETKQPKANFTPVGLIFRSARHSHLCTKIWIIPVMTATWVYLGGFLIVCTAFGLICRRFPKTAIVLGFVCVALGFLNLYLGLNWIERCRADYPPAQSQIQNCGDYSWNRSV